MIDFLASSKHGISTKEIALAFTFVIFFGALG